MVDQLACLENIDACIISLLTTGNLAGLGGPSDYSRALAALKTEQPGCWPEPQT